MEFISKGLLRNNNKIKPVKKVLNKVTVTVYSRRQGRNLIAGRIHNLLTCVRVLNFE